MSQWADNIRDLHSKYGFHESVAEMDDSTLDLLLDFRIRFLAEELVELEGADSPEDVVDALIDLIVVAIGTLDLFRVDQDEAWRRVHAANMAKERGIKPGRPNPTGLPDLLKPEGWTAPDHAGNVGLLPRTFK